MFCLFTSHRECGLFTAWFAALCWAYILHFELCSGWCIILWTGDNFPFPFCLVDTRVELKKVKVTPVQALRLCTGRTAHRGSRGIALPFHDHGTRRG